MQDRLQKILSNCGIASRRKAEEWISQGRVTINGQLAGLGDRADPERDEILVDGKPLSQPGTRRYIMLNKPRGYVTTMQDEKGRRTVAELVDCGQRVYPVGRLDMDSEGLLIMTNDGEFANKLLHPSHEVPKTYQVWVKKFTKNALVQMEKPMLLDGYRIRAARVKCCWADGDTAMLEVTIHEGRNRQIRKMAQNCGMNVTRLRRVQEGTLRLGNLEKGKWRELTPQEIAGLSGE